MGGVTTVSRRRERELARIERAGSWARNEARRERYAYLQRSWKTAVLAAVLLLPMMPVLWLVPGWLRGPVAGALVASMGWVLVVQAILITGTAPKMIGGQVEQYTASELKRLRRRGWHVVNGVRLHRLGDIDHVALGPGGLMAFETKWFGTSGRSLDDRVSSAIEQITRNAHWLYSMFPNDVPRDAFTRVVVLWGPVGAAWGPSREVDKTIVVSGSHLRDWLTHQTGQRLSDPTIRRVWSALERQLAVRDEYDLERRGRAPRPVGDVAIGTCVVALVVSLAVGGVLAAFAHGVASGISATAALGVGCVVAGHVARSRRRSLSRAGSGGRGRERRSARRTERTSRTSAR